MKRRLHDIIDIIATLVLISLLFVPALSQGTQSQAKTNVSGHRVVITGAHHRKGAFPARP